MLMEPWLIVRSPSPAAATAAGSKCSGFGSFMSNVRMLMLCCSTVVTGPSTSSPTRSSRIALLSSRDDERLADDGGDVASRLDDLESRREDVERPGTPALPVHESRDATANDILDTRTESSMLL